MPVKLETPAIDASHVVTYTYDSQGRVSGLRFNGADYIRNISWAPFGGIRGWTWAWPGAHPHYDQNARMDQMNHGTLQYWYRGARSGLVPCLSS